MHVQAGGEGPITGAGNDHGAHVGVDGEGVNDGFELEPHGLEEGIHLLGAVDLDMGDEGGGSGDQEVLVGGFGSHGEGCLLEGLEGLGWVGGIFEASINSQKGNDELSDMM